MKVVGLITEYNPFHNGHKYHIQEAKKKTGADYVIVIMSGNFVQRGTPAMMDKYQRTKMALLSGADLVIELPVCYATASAEFFALGAVSILDKLGVVTDLCFGSECGDISILSEIAKLLLNESKEYKTLLSQYLKEGKTFPEARMEAMKNSSSVDYSNILSSPNNILGIEYMKALLTLNSSINPVTITRITAHYHNDHLTDTGNTSTSDSIVISSATAIRKVLKDSTNLALLKHHIPSYVYDIMKENHKKSFPIYEDDYSLLLNYKLMSESNSSLIKYTDISNDIANRISNLSHSSQSFSELGKLIKSRQLTLTRVNRVLSHILLNLMEEDFKTYNATGYVKYARILGFNKISSPLIRQIVKNEKITVITKVADAKNSLDDISFKMFQEDINSAHLYNHVIYHKYHTLLKDEYKTGVIMI
jgi:cytidyltransferase-like protein